MMKKFKEINIYTGYAENDIQNIVEFSATSLLAAVSLVEQTQLELMLQDDEELDEAWYKEFFGNGRVYKGNGIVNAGEENVLLVLGEDSEWYDKVDTHYEWDDQTFEKWVEFLEASLDTD